MRGSLTGKKPRFPKPLATPILPKWNFFSLVINPPYLVGVSDIKILAIQSALGGPPLDGQRFATRLFGIADSAIPKHLDAKMDATIETSMFQLVCNQIFSFLGANPVVGLPSLSMKFWKSSCGFNFDHIFYKLNPSTYFFKNKFEVIIESGMLKLFCDNQSGMKKVQTRLLCLFLKGKCSKYAILNSFYRNWIPWHLFKNILGIPLDPACSN